MSPGNKKVNLVLCCTAPGAVIYINSNVGLNAPKLGLGGEAGTEQWRIRHKPNPKWVTVLYQNKKIISWNDFSLKPFVPGVFNPQPRGQIQLAVLPLGPEIWWQESGSSNCCFPAAKFLSPWGTPWVWTRRPGGGTTGPDSDVLGWQKQHGTNGAGGTQSRCVGTGTQCGAWSCCPIWPYIIHLACGGQKVEHHWFIHLKSAIPLGWIKGNLVFLLFKDPFTRLPFTFLQCGSVWEENIAKACLNIIKRNTVFIDLLF